MFESKKKAMDKKYCRYTKDAVLNELDLENGQLIGNFRWKDMRKLFK